MSRGSPVLLSVPLVAGMLGAARTDDARRPNFIVIVCDNLGYGDIEPFGSTLHRTPNLNRMAREGRRFTHFCVTAGVCTPSRASIMTGCYAQRVGMHTNPRDGQVLRPISPYGLSPEEVTIAEVLKRRGYATACIGKWHLGDQPQFLPTRQGFDMFFGVPYSDDMTQAAGERLGEPFDGSRWPPLPLLEYERVIEAPVDRNLLTRRYTHRALAFIDRNKDRPFLLYFPQAMPGSTPAPFASPRFRGRSLNGPWGDSVEELDWSTGQVLDKLVQLGIDRRTLVIWTSDNGAPLARDATDPSRGVNRPLYGRGYTTSEGAFRVPTIAWWPGTVPAGTVCDELATTMDLLPTFARIAGATPPRDRTIDGHDILPLLLAHPDAKSPYDVFYYYAEDQIQAVRSGPWKLFLPLKRFSRHPHFRRGETATALLFNVVTDVGSTRDIAAEHRDVVERLMALAEPARNELGDGSREGRGQRAPGRVAQPSPRLLERSDAPGSVRLAADGKALYSVVVAERASDRVRQAAKTLADYLGRIAGARFAVETGDGEIGITVGRAEDFPALELASLFNGDDAERREEYLLRSHAKGVRLVGATELAVEHAVWDFLYRLGYRQFFPGTKWEIVPSRESLDIDMDSFERPAYFSRRIWYGYGPWEYAREPYRDWCAKNRAVQGIQLRTGHAYDGVVRAAREAFDQHPEYWPLLGGERKPVGNPKPCLGNPAVRALFVKHALLQFEKDPSLDSVSMDPSDGGGWCECEQCRKLGTVSDQTITLANEVAAAVDARFPGKRIGMYAYNYHSPPPNVRVHPNVVISVATAFIKGGQSLDEILSGWSAQDAKLGIREYYSVNPWDRDQPGHARGGNLDYLRRTIPEFHAKGARFMSAESSDNWGPNGLGYYLASRMLWDVREAERMDALVEDFLRRAFGPAREPMREFYRQIDGSKPHLVVDDQLGRMFRALAKARALAKSPEIRARVDDLVLYAEYSSLYHRYATANGAERQSAFEALIRHAYRMRRTMLVHTKALYRDLVRRDKTVAIPANRGWKDPEEKNPWKTSAPFSETEIGGYLKEGVARHRLVKLTFKPATFSEDLVPAAAALGFPATAAVGEFGPGRHKQTFYTYAETAPSSLDLRITGGLIEHYRDRGNVKVELFRVRGASPIGARELRVASDRSVPPDGVERAVTLQLTEPGLYKVAVSDGGDRTEVRWPENRAVTMLSSRDSPANSYYRQWMGYFYVPKGTTTIGLFGGGHGEIRDSQDRPHFWLNGREPDFYSVPVPPGEDGTIWHVRYAKGAIRLLTVPPYFATTPRGLLLPREVVEKDAKAVK